MLRTEPLADHNFQALQRFSEAVWSRPRTAAYYRWRYLDVPGVTMLLAMRDEECVATISAFHRKYRVGETVVEAMETCDWYTLPSERNSGIGVRLMTKMVGKGSNFALGGSPDTLELLPRMKFQDVARASEHFLPLSGRYVLRNKALPGFARVLAEPLLGAAATLRFKPKAPAARFRAEHIPLSRLSAEWIAVDGEDAFRSVPDLAEWHWIARCPCGGEFTATGLFEGERLLGWTVNRLYRAGGLLRGAILEMRLASDAIAPAAALLAAAGRDLAERGADDVRGVTTSHVLREAFGAAGYREAPETVPLLVGPRLPEAPLERTSFSRASDGTFWPLEEAAPEAQAAPASAQFATGD